MHLNTVVENRSFQRQTHVPVSCCYQFSIKHTTSLKMWYFAFVNILDYGYAWNTSCSLNPIYTAQKNGLAWLNIAKDELCHVHCVYLTLPCQCIFWFWDNVRTLSFFPKKKKISGEARVKSGTSTIWQRVKILILASGTFWDDCAHALVSAHALRQNGDRECEGHMGYRESQQITWLVGKIPFNLASQTSKTPKEKTAIYRTLQVQHWEWLWLYLSWHDSPLTRVAGWSDCRPFRNSHHNVVSSNTCSIM